VAATIGIVSDEETGPATTLSVRGKEVTLYGKGVYHHMSAEVAPQGIAQDYVTLFLGVPLLLAAVYLFSRDNFRGKIFLAGVLAYFLVTYTFYTLLAMYNKLFLLWVLLISLGFHAFYLVFTSIDRENLLKRIKPSFPRRFVGWFLMFTAVAIGLLWLSIVLPHTLSGTIPPQTEHYTTLVVQALDLAILLPVSFIAGFLILRSNPSGFKPAVVYIIFLSLQMVALTAKIVAMGLIGYNVVPAVFIIPALLVAAFAGAILSVKNIRSEVI
jgi:hypothetical protein